MLGHPRRLGGGEREHECLKASLFKDVFASGFFRRLLPLIQPCFISLPIISTICNNVVDNDLPAVVFLLWMYSLTPTSGHKRLIGLQRADINLSLPIATYPHVHDLILHFLEDICPIDIHMVPAKSDRKFSSMCFEVTRIPW